MTRLFNSALAIVLAVAFAAAPDAQRRPADADPGGQSEPPITNAGADTDDRDPGSSPPLQPLAPGPDIDDSDDSGLAVLVTELVPYSHAQRESNGRTASTSQELSARSARPYDGPLLDGRTDESVALAEARLLSAAPYTGPLDDGRPAGMRPRAVFQEASPEVLSTESVAARTNEAFSLSVVTPNPASEHATVTIVSEDIADATVTVFDVQGRELARAFNGVVQPSSPARVDLDLAGLAPGTYVVVLRIGGARTSQTFQVVR